MIAPVVSSRSTFRRGARTYRLLISVIMVSEGLMACTVGPEFIRPTAPIAMGYPALPDKTTAAGISDGKAQHFKLGGDVPGHWWDLFHSQRLSALVERTLKANPNVRIAEAALRQAKENVFAQQGFSYPGIQANASWSRQRNAVGTVSPTLTSGAPVFSLYTPQVNVVYTLDVFGGNRRQIEALQAQAGSQQFELEATYLTLTTNVVVGVIQQASLRAQIAATREVVRIEAEQVDILQRQLSLGAVAQSDVVAQKSILAQTQASLIPLLKQLGAQDDLLTALAGGFPDESPIGTFDLDDLQLPVNLPVSLPSRLVEQRPDIRYAEDQMHAACAQVGVALANQLPQVLLTANAGSTATLLADLFASGTGFWSIGASVAHNVFDGGTLLHRKRAAEAALEQAAAQYRNTVITAFQNVADSLQALQHDAEALKAQLAAERAAADSLAIARRQLKLGAISYLALLGAEQGYQQAVINLIQARASRYADTVALYQALGGGWWNRDHVGMARSSSTSGGGT